TPRGIVELLRRYDVPIASAEVTVIGRGITVGRSLGLLLTRRSENATVTLCHTGTRDLAAHTRAADIVVVAAGRPGLLTADMVRPGAAVLDVDQPHRGGPGRRRGPGRGRGGGLSGADARRRRAHDQGHAAGQCGRGRRGGRRRGLAWPAARIRRAGMGEYTRY